MNIDIAKNSIVDCLIKSIYIDCNDNWSMHPLRVMQALKSIVGLDLEAPSDKLIEWGNEYITQFESINETGLKFNIEQLSETISLPSLEIALDDSRDDESFQILSQLSSVSDGRPILEFLLEYTLKNKLESFLFIWTAYRVNQFLQNEKISPLLYKGLQSIIEKKEDQFIESFEFEIIGQLIAIESEPFVRNRSIHPLVVNIIDGKSRPNSSPDSIIDIFNIEQYGRKGILRYLENDDTTITPLLLLKLDAFRAALKSSPNKTHPKIIFEANKNIIGYDNAE